MKHLIAITLFLACAANAYGGGFGQSLSNGGNAYIEGQNYMQEQKLREYLDNCIKACGADGYCQAQCMQAFRQPARQRPNPSDFGSYDSLRSSPSTQPYAPPTQTVCRWVYGVMYCDQQ